MEDGWQPIETLTLVEDEPILGYDPESDWSVQVVEWRGYGFFREGTDDCDVEAFPRYWKPLQVPALAA